MQTPVNFRALFKQPSAFAPMALSLIALAVVLVQLVVAGPAREADEGAAAHLWQLLMAAQVPIVAFFAIKWLLRCPRLAASILALQTFAALAALAPVYLLNW